MNSVEKFKTLKTSLEETKLEKVRVETQLETLTKRKQEVSDKILELTGASDIEEAQAKLEQLKIKIDENLAKLEALFDETDI